MVVFSPHTSAGRLLTHFAFTIICVSVVICAAKESTARGATPILPSRKTNGTEETRSHATWIFLDTSQTMQKSRKPKIEAWSSRKSSSSIKMSQRKHSHEPHAADRQESGPWQSDGNDHDDEPAGTTKTPGCAQYGRYYCSYKEDYPLDVVSQVIKYMKWPLEKLFRDLRNSRMPRIADNADGSLVCDSITRIVRPGWAKNNNNRWVVVVNTESYQQYVTEVICRYDNSYCNFVPPCYLASCQQRYNIQTLLVIDPYNPYKGPFLSKFLFPSCCVCYVPKLKTEKAHEEF